LRVHSIPAEIIDRIQETTDIVNLISGYLNLKKAGQNFQGLCPFHSEKTPSFTVSPSKQIFHCFGCQTGGDVFKFLMLKERLTFPEAVRELGKIAGISLPEREEAGQNIDSVLVEVNEAARNDFHHFLLNDPAAQAARDYLQKRGVSQETIEQFSIGYAPLGWDHSLKNLEKKGFTLAQIEKAGLIVRRSSGEGYHDRFRGRLIFPVFNSQGHCIAFGGRVLDQSLPKYLNSPESPVYQKGRILFALDKVRQEKNRQDSLIIVEGYFDSIRAFQAGIRNVVATCGTALTPYHLQSIRRMVQRVYLIFDPDEAGIRAALRTIDLFLESGVKAFVVVLPDGLDPDLFLQREGKDGFDRCIEKAVPLFEFVLRQTMQKNLPLEIDGKLNVIRELLPFIERISNSVERSYYLTRIANELFISEKDLLDEYKKVQNRVKRPEGPDGIPKTAPKPLMSGVPQEEEYVVRFLLAEKAVPSQIFQYVEPSDFSDPRAGRFVKTLSDQFISKEILNFRAFIDLFSEDPLLYEWLTSLAVKEPEYDFPIQALEESLDKLRQKKKRRLQQELEKMIPLAEQEKNHEKVSGFLKEILKIKSEFNERVKL
jgi:DNA primase